MGWGPARLHLDQPSTRLAPRRALDPGRMHRLIPSLVRRALGGLALVALLSALGGATSASASAAVPRSPVNWCDLHPCVFVERDPFKPDPPPCEDCPIDFDPSSIVVLPVDRFTVGVVNRLETTAVLSGPAGDVVAQIRPGATGLVGVPGPGKFQFVLSSPRVAGTAPPVLTVDAEQG